MPPSSNNHILVPVILAGGSGTRLWPASRTLNPKQFLNLSDGKYSLFQQTLQRIAQLPNTQAPIIVCNEEHRFLVAEQLRQINIKAQSIILEPCARNTAPAIALAAISTLPDDCDLLVLPADHLIDGINTFCSAVEKARGLCANNLLVSFGITPTRAETGYGYIKQGRLLSDGCYLIDQFVEKPSLDKAKAFLDSGNYLWNSGMFCFNAKTFLAELASLAPEISNQCLLAYELTDKDLDFTRISKAAFEACPADSIDYAIMEKTNKAAIVTFDGGWSDIGAWDALWEKSAQDDLNNVIRGDVFIENTQNTLIHAEARLVTAIGLNNIIIIESADAILVANKSSAQDIKKLVQQLQTNNRKELVEHKKVYRPWGWYESICLSERFQVKRILVKPGASLSLQKHKFRAEHWVIVKGVAKVTNGDEVKNYHEDQSTYIPLGHIHRLENPESSDLEIIEIQTGDYLGEDDIERIEDQYGRSY